MEPLLQELIPKLETWIEETRQVFLDDLMELARIPSVACQSDGEYPYGEACARVLEKGGEIARRRGLTPYNHANHCATITLPGRSDRTIGIFCHLDVVAPGNGWQSDPYAPFVRDGHVFARGVTDNKGPAAAMLSLLEFLRRENVELEHSLMLYLGGSEETGMQDLDWYLSQAPAPELSLTPDAQFSVCHGEKGLLSATIWMPLPSRVASFEGGSSANAVPDTASIVLRGCDEGGLRAALGEGFPVERTEEGARVCASGLSAHAATPQSGENAIIKLCRALLDSGCMDAETADFLRAYDALFGDCLGGGFSAACEDEPSGKLTAVGGKLRTKGGVLEQTLDIRYPVTADPDWLAQRVTSAVQAAGFRMEDMQNSQPLFYPADHPLIRMLNDTCNEVLGLELKPYVIGGGTYARKLPMAVAYGHLVRSRPRPGGAGKGGGHQVDECVSIQSLEDLMRVYLRALLRLDQFHA